MLLGFLFLVSIGQDIEFTVDEGLRVEYIMLDIVARDSKGQLVTDLKPSDFVVKDNRKTMQPDVFQILDYRMGNAKNADGVELDLPPRQFILALDTESARYEEGLQMFEQLKAFIKALGDDYPYKVMILSLERDALRGEFVDNSAAALEELEKLEARFKRFSKPYVAPESYKRADMLLFGESQTVDLSKAGRTNFSRIKETVNHLSQLEKAFIECNKHFNVGPCIQDSLAEFMFQQEARSERVFAELEKLAYQFEKVDGIKTLLFVSAGFAFDLNTTPYELANLYLGGRANRNSLEIPGRMFLTRPFQRVAHACTKNRVIFHTFNILNTHEGFKTSMRKGARASQMFNIYRGYRFEMSEGLRGLANESGGRYFNNPVDLGGAIDDAIKGDQFFYVIGYPAPGGRPGKFHKIKVKVKRKGVKLSHRRGYFGR